MPPTHHPSPQALANFLIGDCSPGASLLITRHLEHCLRCASRVHAMGSVGVAAGAISCGEPEQLSPGLEVTRVHGVSGLGEAVFRIRAAPGEPLPLDQPAPIAEILVLEGDLAADGQVYGKGDFLSLEASGRPALVSNPKVGCVYLATAYET